MVTRAILLAFSVCFVAPALAAPPEPPPVPKANLALIDSIGRCEPSARQTFLYILRLVDPRVMNNPTEWEEAVVSEHWLFLSSLAEAGLIDVIGRTTVAEPGAIGIAITRVCSEDEAKRIRANDPTSLAGIHRVEIKPFRVAWPPAGICRRMMNEPVEAGSPATTASLQPGSEPARVFPDELTRARA